MRMLSSIFVCLLLASSGFSQVAGPPIRPEAADRLGLPCAKILQMPSAEWIAKFGQAKGMAAQQTMRAIAAYGQCYDARTNRLGATLARRRGGFSQGARDNFQAFEIALKSFAAKALADAEPEAGAVKTAYAQLYEKQFRYEFYLGYEESNARRPMNSSMRDANAATQANSKPPVTSAKAPARAEDDADSFTKAKNRFGELLGALPEDKMHEVHAAFGEIVGPRSLSQETNLAVYRYAIFILEPPSNSPFAPPPF